MQATQDNTNNVTPLHHTIKINSTSSRLRFTIKPIAYQLALLGALSAPLMADCTLDADGINYTCSGNSTNINLTVHSNQSTLFHTIPGFTVNGRLNIINTLAGDITYKDVNHSPINNTNGTGLELDGNNVIIDTNGGISGTGTSTSNGIFVTSASSATISTYKVTGQQHGISVANAGANGTIDITTFDDVVGIEQSVIKWVFMVVGLLMHKKIPVYI